jgi:membrane fusion protein, multidrug efflux system
MTMKTHNMLLLLITTLGLFGIGCSNKQVDHKETIKYVKTQLVDPQNNQEKIRFNGTIQEQRLVTLSFRVGGPLNKLNVQPGDYVQKGEVIASIDKRDYLIQLRSTKAQFEQLRGEYERYKELFEQEKIPANTFEKVESGYLMAKAAYENAQNQLEDTDLIAPFSGFIHKKMTENYQTVGPGVPIVSMIDLAKLEVVVSVPESQLLEVKERKKGLLTVENSGITDLPVTVVSIGEKTGKDGMFEMKLNFRNKPSLKLYPGMSAIVTMQRDANETHFRIPSSALFHEGGNNYVWIYDPDQQVVEKREIGINNLADEGTVEVVSGLEASESIVTAGIHYLTEGQTVKPIEPVSKTNVGGLL